MTIYSEQNKVTYIADGQASTYVIPFYFLENNITVYQNQIEKTKDIDYVIQKNANSLGGTILFNKTPNKDDKIIIKRTTKLTQEVMFLEGESFPASDFETSLDKIVMSLQELKESLSRCISIDYNTDLTNEDISKFLILANENFQTIINFEKTISKFVNLEDRFTIKVGPLSIATLNISEDETFNNYPYHLDIPVEKAQEKHTASVILNLEDATSGLIAPITDCYNGYVRIYLKEILSKDTIEIPIILLQ